MREAEPVEWRRMARLYQACPLDASTELCGAAMAVKTIPPGLSAQPALPAAAPPPSPSRGRRELGDEAESCSKTTQALQHLRKWATSDAQHRSFLPCEPATFVVWLSWPGHARKRSLAGHGGRDAGQGDGA